MINVKLNNPTSTTDGFRTYVIVETYKGRRIMSNGHCHFVNLGGRKRYFGCYDKDYQIKRCRKEIDDFKEGKIR